MTDNYEYYEDEGSILKNNKTKKLGTEEDYEFYDAEINDLDEGENNYNESPSLFGLIGGGLALLACLVIVCLMGVIYHRDRTSITLSHLIMACLGVCVAGLAAAICLMTKGSLSKRVEPNHLLIGVALVLSLVFFGYFLASSLYMFMYRPFHYGYMIHTNNNSEDWNDTFGDDWTFEDGWGENRRILWWVAFFGVVACVGFLIASICLWLSSRYATQTGKMCLGAACFAGVLLGCFAIDYLWTARNYYGHFSFRDNNGNMLTTLMILLIIGIILLFLNAILNIFRKRSGHFIFGVLLIVWVFVTVCVLGLLLRDMRKRQFNEIKDNSSCSKMLDSMHQDDISHGCSNKYINQTCTKQFLVARWETDGKPAFLNPGCCSSVQNWLLWPLYICGCLTLLMITAVLIAVAFNLYLADKSEYLEFEDKKIGLPEIIFAVCCVLALIAFGFYWGFADRATLPRTNDNNPDVIYNSYTKGVEGYNDNNFTPVDLAKVYGGEIPQSAYVSGPNEDNKVNTESTNYNQEKIEMFTKNNILTAKVVDGNCPTDKTKCGLRIGILAVNGRLSSPPSNVKGSSDARILFYNDKNIKNDFKLIKGTPADLNAYLSTLKVYPHDLGYETVVYFKGEQLDLSTLGALGLKSNEAISPTTLTQNGVKFVSNANWQTEGYQSPNMGCYSDNSCTSSLECVTSGLNCQKGFIFHSSDGTIDVVVPLKILDKDGNRIPYPDNTLRSSSDYNYNGNKIPFNQVTLNNSQLTMRVPKPIKNDLVVNMNLYDTANKYLPANQSYSVPANSKSPYVANDILLLTKNGKGCVGEADENACFANQKLSFTDIEVVVKSQADGEVLKDKVVKLSSGMNATRFIGSKTTNKTGNASFDDVAYDYYTVNFEGDTKYLPATQQFRVQGDMEGDVTLFLNRRDTTAAVIEYEVANSATTDRDLALAIKSGTSAKECTVDPLNKWCAYAEHITDIKKNKLGYEKIRLNKFTVSHYLAFTKEAPAYSGTCATADPNRYKYYPNTETTMRSLKQVDNFDWEGVRKLAAGDYQTLYCFTGWGLNSKKTHRVTGNGDVVSASVCEAYYPDDNKYSVASLKAANSR